MRKLLSAKLSSIVFPIIFLTLAGWTGYELYRTTMGFQNEILSLSNLELEIEDVKISGNRLEIMIKGENPSTEWIKVTRLQVVVELTNDSRGQVYVGGDYKLFETNPLILEFNSSLAEKFELYSDTLMRYAGREVYLDIEISTVASTEHIKDITTKYHYRVPVLIKSESWNLDQLVLNCQPA